MTTKITVKELTAAIDTGSTDLWDTLSDEEKKSVSFYTAIRYASSVKLDAKDEKKYKISQSIAQETAIFKTNEYYNKHYFQISKHPKLLWHLLCMCGNENKNIYYHEWFGFKKKVSDNKLNKFLEQQFPSMKLSDIELLASLKNKKDIEEFAKELGFTDKDIKKML